MITLSCQPHTLPIHRIDEAIFTTRYHADCLEYGCGDSCCSYGCPADLVEVERIMSYKDKLESLTGRDSAQWFVDNAEANADYPSGVIRRTRVYDGNCVFHNRASRGCILHGMALEKGIDPHQIKPMVCFFFPLTWDGDYLHVAEFLDELYCRQCGVLIIDSLLDEIRYYLGEEVAGEMELDRKRLSQA